MPEYKIEKRDISVFTAEYRTDKKITNYEFQKFYSGWFIREYKFDANHPFPKEQNMFIPDEVMQTISKEYLKEQLKK